MYKFPLSVFIDTNFFIKIKFDFENHSEAVQLKKLASEGKIKIYISNVVRSEAINHLNSYLKESLDLIEKIRKDITNKISIDILDSTEMYTFLNMSFNDNYSQIGIRKFDDYLSSTGIIILDNSDVYIDKILDDYFLSKPPFENKSKKKHEFPDAIILHKLKSIFNQHNPLWVISEDVGFQSALNTIAGFNCVTTSRRLFDKIYSDEFLYKKVVIYFNNEDNLAYLKSILKESLENSEIDIDGSDYDRKGISSGFDYDEVSINDIFIESIKFDSVDDINQDKIKATAICKVKISALCNYTDYDNSYWDSEEHEYLILEERSIVEIHMQEIEVNFDLIVIDDNESDEIDDNIRFNFNEESNIHFELESLDFDLSLDQYSRVSRKFIETEDKYEDFESESHDQLESNSLQEKVVHILGSHNNN